MAYTASFLVKNQAVGDKFQHHIRVTADALSGSFDTGHKVVDFIQYSIQSATTTLMPRVFMNKAADLTALNGTIAISGATSGDEYYFTVIGH